MSNGPIDTTGRDPFGSATSAQAYVSRSACERALDELLAAVRRGAPCTALVGPNGIGKTQLVRVLAERLADEVELLVLPYAAVDFPDLCHWVLGLLGEPQGPFSDPGGALLEAATTRSAAGRRLVLALDDASGLPMETARELMALIRQAEGALQLVVIPVDDPRAGRVLAALGSDLALVRFNTPMSADETQYYIRERLRTSEANPVLCNRFTDPVIAWLHRESGGLPRELHILAVEFLRDRPAGKRDRFARSEQWLELDAHEVAAEPAVEAELLGPEEAQPEPPEVPAPAAKPKPKVEAPPPNRAPLRSAPEDRSWLRNHLPLVVGLALVALGAFFALRGGQPAPAAFQPPVVEPQAPVKPPVPREPASPPVPVRAQPPAIPEQPPAFEDIEPLTSATPEPTPVSDDPTPEEAPADSLVVETPDAPAEEPVEVDTGIAVLEPPPLAPPEAAVITPMPEAIAKPEPAPPAPSRVEETPSSAPSPARQIAPPTAAPARAPRLLPVEATGPPVTIRVDADPPAHILIDGREQGQTPLVDLELASGRHRFEIIFPDGTRLLRQKRIGADRLELRFTQPPEAQSTDEGQGANPPPVGP